MLIWLRLDSSLRAGGYVVAKSMPVLETWSSGVELLCLLKWYESMKVDIGGWSYWNYPRTLIAIVHL